MRPNDRLQDLVAYALDEREAPRDVTSAEKERVAQLRAARAAFAVGVFHAPAQVVQAAKAIFAPSRVPLMARLVGSTLRLADARGSSATAFQASFECELGKARLAYSPLPEGWSVMGRVDSEGWTVESGGQTMMADDGSFECTVASLEDAELTLIRGDDVWIIPAISQELDDDDRRRD